MLRPQKVFLLLLVITIFANFVSSSHNIVHDGEKRKSELLKKLLKLFECQRLILKKENDEGIKKEANELEEELKKEFEEYAEREEKEHVVKFRDQLKQVFKIENGEEFKFEPLTKLIEVLEKEVQKKEIDERIRREEKENEKNLKKELKEKNDERIRREQKENEEKLRKELKEKNDERIRREQEELLKKLVKFLIPQKENDEEIKRERKEHEEEELKKEFEEYAKREEKECVVNFREKLKLVLKKVLKKLNDEGIKEEEKEHVVKFMAKLIQVLKEEVQKKSEVEERVVNLIEQLKVVQKKLNEVLKKERIRREGKEHEEKLRKELKEQNDERISREEKEHEEQLEKEWKQHVNRLNLFSEENDERIRREHEQNEKENIAAEHYKHKENEDKYIENTNVYFVITTDMTTPHDQVKIMNIKKKKN